MRLENRTERQRHIDDLTGLIAEPESRALWDLAENPLLLTIICLVHRIDAVLPDERVVLYQKCTETLLNTWHKWKFRSDGARNRGKVERRNRARMQAIADWFHRAFGEMAEQQRAVVPYDLLKGFLTDYIEDIEEPEDDDAEELAENFLRFVRERAGLLIEVGDGQYSFVHLTFQEYLTATFLKASGEIGGIEVIWESIAERCGNTRWEEVIRLMLGELEQRQSQQFLLERILPAPGDDDFEQRSLLAGGCLLDRIDAAEVTADEIVPRLLAVAAMAESVEALRKPLRLLRIWQDRDPGNRELIAAATKKISEDTSDDTIRTALALNLVSLGWEDGEIRTVSDQLTLPGTHTSQRFALLLAEDPAGKPRLEPAERKFLDDVLIDLARLNRGPNLASILLAALCSTRDEEFPCPSIILLVGTVTGLSGPFRDAVANCLVCGGITTRVGVTDGSYGQDAMRAVDSVLVPGKFWGNDRLERLKAVLLQFSSPTRNPRQTRQAVAQAPDWWLIRPGTKQGLFEDLVLNDPEIHSPIVDILCDLLKLSPRAPWWEAIRMGALPRVPGRITLADPAVWQRTREAFAEGRAEQGDCEHAACQLLLDVWLYLADAHARPEESPFAELAELTREVDAAPLRVVHCIRDIAYGGESRVADLEAMVRSEEPAYKKLFEDAFWREREEKQA